MPTNRPAPTTPFRTYSGKYYAGMTRQEAEKKGIYEESIGLDFKDIDKYPKDDVLSYEEIVKARQKEGARDMFSGAGAMLAGAGLMIVGVVLEAATEGLATPISAGLFLKGNVLLSAAGTVNITQGLYEILYSDTRDANSLRTYVNKTKEGIKSIFTSNEE